MNPRFNLRVNLIFLISSLLLFILLAVGVANHFHPIQNFDNQIAVWVNGIHFPTLDEIMLLVTKLGNPYESIFIFIVFSVLFIAKKKKMSFYILAIATADGTILPEIIKNLIARPRPESLLLQETGYSFPSGHAVMSTVFLLSSFFLIAPLIKNKTARIVFLIIATIVFVSIALSRIYLSVHFTSDVIAGIFLGIFSFSFAILNCCQEN